MAEKVGSIYFDLDLGDAKYDKKLNAASLRRAYEQGARDILETLASYEDYSGIQQLGNQMK